MSRRGLTIQTIQYNSKIGKQVVLKLSHNISNFVATNVGKVVQNHNHAKRGCLVFNNMKDHIPHYPPKVHVNGIS